MSEPGDSPSCLNCGTPLGGQYCRQCGQRANTRFISLFELLRDAFGDLFELDSRLWRTLTPLLFKPGLLTRDYLEGKRARYMPPFRMYLVLSLVFFAIAFFDPQDELAILYEAPPATEVVGEGSMLAEDVDAKVRKAREEGRLAVEQLIEDGVIDAEDIPDEFRDLAGEVAARQLDVDNQLAGADGADDDTAPGDEADDSGGVNITFDDDTGVLGSCTLGETDMSDAPDWLKKRFTPERLVAACERINDIGLKGLVDAILGNIPAALIILLPFMAFVLKTLYPLSRRYYVEHLLFFIHYHAFFFLILSLEILLSRISNWIGFAEGLFTLVNVAASFYIPVYLFMAMRRVYGQGRFITVLKYIWLMIWYLAGFTLVMLGAVLTAVFSI
jgi:hypothetical protein